MSTTNKVSPASYLLGVATTLILCGLAGVFVVWRIGAERVRWAFETAVFGPSYDRDNPPQSLLPELIALGAVVDNTDNPTGAAPHETFMVRSDPKLGYVLKPNVTGDAYTLPSRRYLNLYPPILFLPANATRSPALTSYVQSVSRLHYRFSTTPDGFRTTVPPVVSPRRILMIGDSAAFGEGVADDVTMASFLQRRLGAGIQVLNTAVSGYNAREITAIAQHYAERPEVYDALIYVAHENDFRPPAYVETAEQLVRHLFSLSERFSRRVIVVQQTYLQYAARDVVVEEGPSFGSDVDALRTGLAALIPELGGVYVDWTELAHRYRASSRTLFSPFALYVDYAHWSPEGNRMVADAVYQALQQLKAVD